MCVYVKKKKYWETTGEKTRIRLNTKKINCKNDLIYCNLSPRKGNKAELGKKLGQVVWWKILTQTFNVFFWNISKTIQNWATPRWRVMSATYRYKTSLVLSSPPLNSNNSASIHGQKYLWWSCRFQHHSPRNPGGVSPIYVLGNRQTDLNTEWALQRTMNQLQPLSAIIREPLENTEIGNHSQTRKSLWKFRLPEKFQQSAGTKKTQV